MAVVGTSYFYVVFYIKFYFHVFSKCITQRHERKLLVIEFKVFLLSVLFASEVNYDLARCLGRRVTYPLQQTPLHFREEIRRKLKEFPNFVT